MKRRTAVFGILAILLLSAIAIGSHAASVYKNVNAKKSSNFGWVVEINGIRYTTHDVIRINSNADFNSTNGVVGGNGTKDDPYIISGWDIDDHNVGDAIYIGNTTAYFVVKNTYLHNASDFGISLYNVTNGIIANNNCNDNWVGIELKSSNSITISNNTCNDNNNGYGIYLSSSSNNTISNNICNNDGDGIHMDFSNNNTISNNICSSYDDGIYLDFSSSNTVSNNTCINNWEGIYVGASSSNIVSNNTCNNNGEGIDLWQSSHNTIFNNILTNNGDYGVYVRSKSSYNYILKNSFFYNHGSGDTYNSSHIQAYDAGSNNYWNNTTIGNYWHDWANNNATNDENPHDGIVDWLYKIDGNAGAKDNYPLKGTTVKLVPLAPSDLSAVAGNGYVNLTWKAPRGNGTSPITAYHIYRNGALIATAPANHLWYNDTNVVGGQAYTYYVTAVNSVGESEKSNEVSATPWQAVPEFSTMAWLAVTLLIALLGALHRSH